MANRIRNTYNNDRLMWLGSFSPALRTPKSLPPEKKLSTPSQYPPKQGPITQTVRFLANSLMEDGKTKVFLNGSRVLDPLPMDLESLPIVEDNDLITIYIYAEATTLPKPAHFVLAFAPIYSGDDVNFPAIVSCDTYGYVNGLTATPGIVGSPVSNGAPLGSVVIQLEYITEKSISLFEEELAQLVVRITSAGGKDTELGIRLQVVMCEKLERYQAVQHNGTAGGQFLWDFYQIDQIYTPSTATIFSPFDNNTVGQVPYLYHVSDVDGIVKPTPASLTQSTVSGSPSSFTVTFSQHSNVPNAPTGTYQGRANYAAGLNLVLGSLSGPLTLAQVDYTSGISPPGSLFGPPPYSITVTTEQGIQFESTWKESIVQQLPNPTSDPEATYEEVIVQSTPVIAAYPKFVVNNIGDYRYPPVPLDYFIPGPQVFGSTPAVIPLIAGVYPSDQPWSIYSRAILYASTYRLNQYVDPETPEANPQPGRVAYIMLTSSVTLSDEDYQALIAAGVDTLDSLASYIEDNPGLGEARINAEFDLDLNTPQMESLLGTGENLADLSDAELQQLYNSLAFRPSEEYRTIAGNILETKLTPPSPSFMDKLRMVIKVGTGVNSLVTLGKILGNIGVLTTPLGILMLINTGINIYNGVQAADGLLTNQQPKYIPTVGDVFFNAFKTTPTSPQAGTIRPVPPRLIP